MYVHHTNNTFKGITLVAVQSRSNVYQFHDIFTLYFIKPKT
jgi:hypothetical protein